MIIMDHKRKLFIHTFGPWVLYHNGAQNTDQRPTNTEKKLDSMDPLVLTQATANLMSEFALGSFTMSWSIEYLLLARDEQDRD